MLRSISCCSSLKISAPPRISSIIPSTITFRALALKAQTSGDLAPWQHGCYSAQEYATGFRALVAEALSLEAHRIQHAVLYIQILPYAGWADGPVGSMNAWSKTFCVGTVLAVRVMRPIGRSDTDRHFSGHPAEL